MSLIQHQVLQLFANAAIHQLSLVLQVRAASDEVYMAPHHYMPWVIPIGFPRQRRTGHCSICTVRASGSPPTMAQ
jgi:hypothetical protein